MIDPYAYSDYRLYLKDWFAARKRRPTQAAFADSVGCAPSMVSQILKGTRSLDPSAVGLWSRELGHDADRTQYFANLVDMNDQTSSMRKFGARAYVRSVQRFRRAASIDDGQVAAITHWYYGAILELARCDGFVGEAEWVAAHLRPPVPVEEVELALRHLLASGLLEQDGERVRGASPDLLRTEHDVPRGVASEALLEWYTGTFERAAAELTASRPAERHFSTVMLALPESALPQVRELLKQLEVALVSACVDLKQDRDRVYQISIALFPVSESTVSRS